MNHNIQRKNPAITNEEILNHFWKEEFFKWMQRLSLHPMKKLLSSTSPFRKKYLRERNALTVMASLFCFAMMVVAFGKQAWLECTAFALAFSFSIEVICHRAKEKS